MQRVWWNLATLSNKNHLIFCKASCHHPTRPGSALTTVKARDIYKQWHEKKESQFPKRSTTTVRSTKNPTRGINWWSSTGTHSTALLRRTVEKRGIEWHRLWPSTSCCVPSADLQRNPTILFWRCQGFLKLNWFVLKHRVSLLGWAAGDWFVN